jgi:tryptophan halogenase
LADGRGGDIPFSDAVTLQDKVCEAMRGPKRLDDPQYGGPMAYAYHFDAGKLAGLLRDVGKATGVKHLLGNVLAVNKADDGAIASVHDPRARRPGRPTSISTARALPAP